MLNGTPTSVFSSFAFIGFILVCIPFPWHFEAWNTGTCLYMAWTALGCLNAFINAIVWNNNAINWAPVWCDISSRFMVGLSVAIPAASLCINRRLYVIASVKSATVTKAEKRRAIMIDLSIALGLPVLDMILHVIVQGHRFDIYEDFGCFPSMANTPPTYALVFCWPLAIGLVSAVYCGLAIRALARRRADFNQLLASNRNLNSARYFRLMGLSAVDLLFGTPASAFTLYLNIVTPGGIQPWVSWAYTHFDFSRVDQYPAVIWKQNSLVVIPLEMARWSPVICAIVFFVIFGFAEEARKNYRLAFESVAKKVGYTTGTMFSGMSSSFGGKQMMSTNARGTLPVFIRQETVSKRDSFNSFSSVTDLTIGDVGGTLDDKSPHSPPLQYSYDEKRPMSTVSRPEPTLDPNSISHRSIDAPARPDSVTIV